MPQSHRLWPTEPQKVRVTASWVVWITVSHREPVPQNRGVLKPYNHLSRETGFQDHPHQAPRFGGRSLGAVPSEALFYSWGN